MRKRDSELDFEFWTQKKKACDINFFKVRYRQKSIKDYLFLYMSYKKPESEGDLSDLFAGEFLASFCVCFGNLFDNFEILV